MSLQSLYSSVLYYVHQVNTDVGVRRAHSQQACVEYRALEQEVVELNEVQGGVVCLDVGGRLFHSTRETFGKYDSSLRAVFNSFWHDGESVVYYDQDYRYFDVVLEWLRSDVVYVAGRASSLCREACATAVYFVLYEFVDAVDALHHVCVFDQYDPDVVACGGGVYKPRGINWGELYSRVSCGVGERLVCEFTVLECSEYGYWQVRFTTPPRLEGNMFKGGKLLCSVDSNSSVCPHGRYKPTRSHTAAGTRVRVEFYRESAVCGELRVFIDDQQQPLCGDGITLDPDSVVHTLLQLYKCTVRIDEGA